MISEHIQNDILKNWTWKMGDAIYEKTSKNSHLGSHKSGLESHVKLKSKWRIKIYRKF